MYIPVMSYIATKIRKTCQNEKYAKISKQVNNVNIKMVKNNIGLSSDY